MCTANGFDPVSAPRGSAFFRRRLIEPLQDLLGGGLEARSLARALAVGALIGSMPLAWGTSLLALGAALPLRLNPLAVQVGNFAAWPLQIALAYPYFIFGSAWFAPEEPGSTPDSLLHTLARANGAALGAWALTVPLLLPLLYALGRLLIAGVGRGLPKPGKE